VQHCCCFTGTERSVHGCSHEHMLHASVGRRCKILWLQKSVQNIYVQPKETSRGTSCRTPGHLWVRTMHEAEKLYMSRINNLNPLTIPHVDHGCALGRAQPLLPAPSGLACSLVSCCANTSFSAPGKIVSKCAFTDSTLPCASELQRHTQPDWTKVLQSLSPFHYWVDTAFEHVL
jgi:hypothetical protein